MAIIEELPADAQGSASDIVVQQSAPTPPMARTPKPSTTPPAVSLSKDSAPTIKKEKAVAAVTLDTLGFPVFALCFEPPHSAAAGSKTDSLPGSRLFVAGGGGNSKSGVKNTIAVFQVGAKGGGGGEAGHLFSHTMPQDSGAVMNMCAAGRWLVCGVDSQAVVFDRTAEPKEGEKKASLKAARQFRTDFKKTDGGKYDESYQKVVRSTDDGKLLVTGGTDMTARVWNLPAIIAVKDKDKEKPLFQVDGHQADINDADFSHPGADEQDGSALLLATLSAESVRISDGDKGDLVHELESTLLGRSGAGKVTFRFCRFGRAMTRSALYTVDISMSASRKRVSHVSQWDARSGKLLRSRILSTAAVTAFAVSSNGDLLGYGTADGGVGVVSARDLKMRWHSRGAHGFTVTCAEFDTASSVLATGSADCSCKLHDARRLDRRWDIMSVLAVVLLLLAYLYARSIIARSN